MSGKLFGVFNFFHLTIGLTNLLLIICQFTSARLTNVLADFRVISIVYISAGCFGFWTCAKKSGRLLSGSLYCLSLIASLWSSIFYAFGLAEESQILATLQGSRKSLNHKHSDFDIQAAKIIICTILIVTNFLEFLNCFSSLIVLKKLSSIIEEKIEHSRRKKRSTSLPFLIVLNLISSLIILILGSIFENLKSKNLKNIQICWPQICGLFGLSSTVLSLMSLSSKRLFTELATVMCIFTSTICLKSMDYGIVSHFPVDVRDYVEFSTRHPVDVIIIDDENMTFKNEPRLRFFMHLSLLAFLFLSFMSNAASAISFGSNQELCSRQQSNNNYHKFLIADGSLKSNRKILGSLHAFCGLAILSLAFSGLWPWSGSKNYDNGAGLVSLGCLFLAAGILTSRRPRTMILVTYTTTVLCFTLSLENGLFSTNQVFQNFRKLDRRSQTVDTGYSNRNAVVLYIIQCVVFVMEFIISSCTLWRFGNCLKNFPTPNTQKNFYTQSYKSRLLILLAIGHLPYALTTLSISILSETTYEWTSLFILPLNFTTNGSVILICSLVQLVIKKRRIVYLISSVLNTVTSTISFFILGPYSAQLYSYWAALDAVQNSSQSNESSSSDQRIFTLHWSIFLTSIVLVVAILEFVVSIASAMICYSNYIGSTSGRGNSIRRFLPKITYNDIFATRTSSYGNLAWNEQRTGSTFQLLDMQQMNRPKLTSQHKSTFTSNYNFLPQTSGAGAGSQFDPKINFWEYFGRNQNFRMT